MKKLALLLAVMIIAYACKDPNVDPGDGKEPVGNVGQIRFDNPALGQISYYVNITSEGYYDPTPRPISTGNDSIRWEITRVMDNGNYEITETLYGDMFNDATGTNNRNTLTLEKTTTGVLIYSSNNQSSPLLGYRDSVALNFGQSTETRHTFWRVESDQNNLITYGHVKEYEINNKLFGKLYYFSDLTPMTYDGAGNVFLYNEEFGLSRLYSVNPWLGDIRGFDLVTEKRTNTDPNKDLIKRWRLAYVHLSNGDKVSIEKLAADDNTERVNFILNINANNTLGGISNCNQYSADYKTDGNKISITNLITTLVYCKFTDVYTEMLTKAQSYKLDKNVLIINSVVDKYVALEFVEDLDTHFDQKLVGTKWALRNVHFNDNSIVPIEKVIGANTNTGSNNFTLYFMEKGKLEGFSGCNVFGGEYKSEGNKLELKGGNITEAYCTFTDVYSDILNESTTYRIENHKLIINSNFSKYQALEFIRII